MVAGSVSHWILQAGSGDERAFTQLHRRYWPRVVGIARSRLKYQPQRLDDAEDVAQRAFLDLYLCFKKARVPNLRTRHQLLALISHIVVCRALNEIRRSAALQRKGSQSVTICLETLLADQQDNQPLQNAILNDCYAVHVEGLPDSLRPFAEMHLAGFSNREIAERMQCVERTVERKVALLRNRWQQLALASLTASPGGLASQIGGGQS